MRLHTEIVGISFCYENSVHVHNVLKYRVGKECIVSNKKILKSMLKIGKFPRTQIKRYTYRDINSMSILKRKFLFFCRIYCSVLQQDHNLHRLV